MVIVFRTDASIEIGLGHFMRCLTLAADLKEKGYECIFICRSGLDNVSDFITQHGFETKEIFYEGPFNSLKDIEETKQLLRRFNRRVSWLIIDHYQIDIAWEEKIRDEVDHILVIDDLANRKHDCDILMDQNFYINYNSRYDQLVPDHCIKLLGPNYLLLRKEFYKLKSRTGRFLSSDQRLFIFYGGSDSTKETLKAIQALEQIDRSSFIVDVVVGNLNPNKELIKLKCQELNINYHQQIDNMAELMLEADFSLGAGGIALWERLYLGLPSIVTIVADNQKETVEALHEQKFIKNLGWYDDVNAEVLAKSIIEYKKQSIHFYPYCGEWNHLFNEKQGSESIIEAIIHVSTT